MREARPEVLVLRCGRKVLTRDLRSADIALYPHFHAKVTAEDRRTRFFTPSPLNDAQMLRLTRLDAANVIIRAAIDTRSDELLGVARLHRIEGSTGEFAVMVRSDVKGQGLGQYLLREVIERAPPIGIDHVVGLILPENAGMCALMRHMGFRLECDREEPGLIRASMELRPVPAVAA